MVAVRAAQLLAADALRDVEALRDTLVAVGEGARTPARGDRRAPTSSPSWRAPPTRRSASSPPRRRARRDLIAAVSHDLRTPITSLRLLAEAVEDDIVDAPTRRGYLGQMRHAHRRARRA